MLNFAEQTGSGAVMLVWSFSLCRRNLDYINCITRKHLRAAVTKESNESINLSAIIAACTSSLTTSKYCITMKGNA